MKKLIIFFLFLSPCIIYSQFLPVVTPESVGLSSTRLAFIDTLFNNQIAESIIPGGVVLVARHGKIAYRKAFGYKSLEPQKEVVSIETIYDLASVTKPVATATAIMMLVEQGKIGLFDYVKKYIPNFAPSIDSSGKERNADIYHLLTHTSGLPDYIQADKILAKYSNPTRFDIINEIATVKRNNIPGKEFTYSCLNFITLAEIVSRVSGKTIDKFTKEEIYKPLGMMNTFYLPPNNRIKDIAPTERNSDGSMIRGVVHDPLASLAKGISGNAGLFSNVDDLAIFMQMMMNGGIYNNTRILGKFTVEQMTKPYKHVSFAGRGLGWDCDSDYMGQRGDIFTDHCYGHTGFTGTSILAVPEKDLFFIILTNRIHPSPKTNLLAFRRLIANIIAASIIE